MYVCMYVCAVKHSMSDELISASAPSSLKLDRPRAGGVTIETGEPANEKYTFPGTMGKSSYYTYDLS